MKRVALLLALWTLLATEGFSETWAPVSSGTSNTINSLFFVSPDTGWIAGENSLIRKTVDGGATWTTQTVSGNIKTIRFANSKVGWAVGESGGSGLVLKTTDGGTTWTPQINAGPVVRDVQIANEYPDHAWIAGAGGFLRETNDGGATWTTDGGTLWPVISSGTDRDIHRMWLHNAGDLIGFVGSHGLISRRLFDETDSIITDSTTTTNDLHDVAFVAFPHDLGLCVGAGGTILRTTDAGVTWTPQNSGTTADLYAVTLVSSRAAYAAGANGVLLRTTDGGETWVSVNSGTTNALHAAGVSLGTGGWIAGNLGTVGKLTSVGPLYLEYGSATYSVGFTIKPRVPKILATAPVRFAVNPALPGGLVLDSVTGIVSGTPAAVVPWTSYVVTATNDLGSLTDTLRVRVLAAPTLTYSHSAPQYAIGVPITKNVATLVRPSMTWDRWEVSPPLPAGLKLDTNRNGGGITGTPTAASPSKDYLVTAIISDGTWVSFTLNITVVDPTSLASHSGGSTFGFSAPGGSSLRFEVPEAASEARMEIFSMQAREVWTSRHTVNAGFVWNGRTGNGTELPGGVYGIRVTWIDHGGRPVGSAVRRFTLLRPAR